MREAHERQAVPAAQAVDRLASVRCCAACEGSCGLLSARLASTGQAEERGEGRDRRAVTSNFSGTGNR